VSEYGLGTAKGRLLIDDSDHKRGIDSAGRRQDEFVSKSEGNARNIQRASQGMLAIAGVGAAGFVVAVKSASDFEKRLSAVQSVSGATAEEMDRLRAKALQLGRDTAFGATDSALAIEELVKAGLNVEDVLNGAADATVALAAAGEIELPMAAEIAAAAMNQFGLAADEMPAVADRIAGAANASAIDVADFGMSITQAGAVANLAGLSFDDTALAITAMGQAGIKGGDAGTSLKTFLQNLQPTTAAQIKLFDQLGLSIEANATGANSLGNEFYNADGSIRSMIEISGSLNTALDGMSDAQKTMALETIFGTDAIRAAGTFANMTTEEMTAMQAVLADTSAADVAEMRLDNLSGSMTILAGSMSTLMIEVGTPFLAFLKSMADRFIVVVNALLNLSPALRNTIVMVGLGGTAFLGFAGALGLAAPFILRAARSLYLIGIAVKAFSAALAANPLVLFIIAVAAVALAFYQLYQNSDQFRAFIDEKVLPVLTRFADRVKLMIEAIIPKLKEWYTYFNDVMLPEIEAFVERAKIAIAKFADYFMENIMPKIEAFVKTYIKLFMAVWKFLLTEVVPAVAKFVVAFVETVAKIVTWIKTVLIPAVRNFVTDFINVVQGIIKWITGTMIPAIKDFVTSFINIVKGIVDWVDDVFLSRLRRFGSFVKEIFMEMWGWIEQNVIPAVQAIAETIGAAIGVIGKIANIIGIVVRFAFGVISTVISAIAKVVGFVGGIIVAILMKIADFISAVLVPIWRVAWYNIQTILETAWAIISSAIEIGVKIVKSIIEIFIGAIVKAWSLFGDNLIDLILLAFNMIKGVVESVLGVITGIAKIFTAILTLDFEKLKEGLLKIWDSLWNLVSTLFSTLWGVIKLLVENALDVFHLAFSIFADTIVAAWDIIWSTIKAGFSIAWGLLLAVFNPLIDALGIAWAVFTTAITAAWGFIWSGLKDTFGAAWDLILAVVNPLIDGFLTTFTTITDALTSAWDLVWSGFSTAVEIAKTPIEIAINAIIAIIERVTGAIDRVRDGLAKLPGLGFLGSDDAPDGKSALEIPEYGNGTIVTKRTLAFIGEAGAEAVVPLTDDRRALELMYGSGLAQLLFSSVNGSEGAEGQQGFGSQARQSGSTTNNSGDTAGVSIEQANFYEQADFDAMLDSAELYTASRGF
jgi:TP901 family phage tail tape measure protein